MENEFKYKWCDKLLKKRIKQVLKLIDTNTLDSIMYMIRKDDNYIDIINLIWDEVEIKTEDMEIKSWLKEKFDIG